MPNLEDNESLATDRDQKLLVASVDAKPVGFAHICAGPTEVRGEDTEFGTCRMFSCQAYANLDELASCCYLRWLGVDQEHRRQGIGHHLLNRALSEAQDEGYERVILNCRENNIAAVSLYTEVGFRTGDVSSAYVKRL